MMTEYACDSDLTNSNSQFLQLNGRRLQMIVDQLDQLSCGCRCHTDHQPSAAVATTTAFDPDSQNPCAADWPPHITKRLQNTINRHQKTVQNTVIRFGPKDRLPNIFGIIMVITISKSSAALG
jgi:hypothetical protein